MVSAKKEPDSEAAPATPKRGRGRPRKTPEATPPQPAPKPEPAEELPDDDDMITDEELEDTSDFQTISAADLRAAQSDPRRLPRRPRLPEEEFFKFVADYPREDYDNLMFYVYRKEPAIKSKRRDPRTGRVITNIDRTTAPQATRAFILQKWGSGKYRIIMTDQGKKGQGTKQICDSIFEINEWDKFPPMFIDPTEIVDCDRNASLISGLIAQRVLKRSPDGALVMADGSISSGPIGGGSTDPDVTRQFIGLTERLMTRLENRNEQSHGNSKIEDAVAALILKQVGNETGGPKTGPDALTLMLLQQIQDEKKNSTMLMMKLLERQETGDKKERNPFANILDLATGMKALSEVGLFGPAAAAAATAADSPWWEKLIEKMAPSVTPLLIKAFTPTQPAMPGQRQPGTPAASAPAPAATPASLTGEGIPVQSAAAAPVNTSEPTHIPATPPEAPAATTDANEPDAGMVQMLGGQVLNHIQRDLGGQDLAHAIFCIYGMTGYAGVTRFGKPKIKTVLMAHPQMGAAFQMWEEKLDSFIDEFFQYQEGLKEDEQQPAA